MIVKYKLSDLARDLNVSNKQIIDLLAADGSEPKKSSANLTDTELNLVFEHFTSTRQVENFNAYFASAEEAKLAAEKKAAEEKAAAEAARKAAEEKAAAEAARKADWLLRQGLADIAGSDIHKASMLRFFDAPLPGGKTLKALKRLSHPINYPT